MSVVFSASVRTSAEFSVNRDGVYGNLSADPRLENLWHVASCSSGQSFAMDFEFQGGGRGGGGGAESWDDDADAGSIVQVHSRVGIEEGMKSRRRMVKESC